MKKLVIAALAIGAMAACTKTNVEFDQPGEISFQPVAQKATKAVVDGFTYPTTNEAYNFNVWAWFGEQEAGTELASFTGTTPYIAEGTFTHKTNAWGGVTPYYWPTKGSLVFAGYSPASAKVSGTTFNYDLTDKKFSVTDYVQSNNIADAKDLMWFDVTAESYDQNGEEGNGVPVIFKHALSWLTFKFNLKYANTAPNWTITNVKLEGIENKATFTAVNNGTPSWTEAVESAEGMDVINVYQATGEDSFTVTYAEAGTVLPGTDVDPESTGVKTNAVLVIPQSCAPGTPANGETAAVPAAAELVITYNLKTYVDNGILTGQEVRLPLNGTNIDDDKWLPGKHYIYTITFGANEILIAPTVTDWDDEPQNIDVL